jgi:RecA-family ATPase
VSDESGLSGSTAWHNSVRSRLYLKTATNDEDARDTGLRVLEMRKSNYGPQAENIPLRWDAGVFKPIESLKQGHERAAAEAADEAVFLNLLGRFTTSGRTVSDKPSRSFAVSQFVLEPEGAALGSKRLDQAMRRLFARNRIGVESYGRPSNPHSKIVTRELF